MNDMPSCLSLEGHCCIYADDSEILLINNCDALLNWTEKWKLDISFEKTSVMWGGSRCPPNCLFYLENYRLAIEKSVRHFGVAYNNKLSYEEHIEKIVSMAYVK